MTHIRLGTLSGTWAGDNATQWFNPPTVAPPTAPSTAPPNSKWSAQRSYCREPEK